MLGKMYCHSHRERLVTLASKSSHPVTYPYLISDPPPAGVTELGIRVLSHDQESSDQPEHGRWTWFEASFLRPQAGSSSGPITSDCLHLVREAPESFTQVFRQSGRDFICMPNVGEVPSTPGRCLNVSVKMLAKLRVVRLEVLHLCFLL